MPKLLLAFIILVHVSFAQNSRHDSLLCNIKNSSTDRLLLYDKDCFVWIKQDSTSLGIMLEIGIGQFKTIGDTIYFTYADSTRSKNKYYCYCSYKGDSYVGFHFYNVPETCPPGSIDRVYKDMFKTTAPALTQYMVLMQFKAVKQNDKIIFLNHHDSGYQTKEYTFCDP